MEKTNNKNMKLFKKKVENKLTTEQEVNKRLNKEWLEAAGFAKMYNCYCFVINQVTLVPEDNLSLGKEELRKDILNSVAPSMRDAVNARLK